MLVPFCQLCVSKKAGISSTYHQSLATSYSLAPQFIVQPNSLLKRLAKVRQNLIEIRSTNISPGAVATELTDHISHKDSKEIADDLYNDAIDSDSIARAIAFAIEQPGGLM